MEHIHHVEDEPKLYSCFNTDSIGQGDQMDFFGASNSGTASYSWNFDIKWIRGS